MQGRRCVCHHLHRRSVRPQPPPILTAAATATACHVSAACAGFPNCGDTLSFTPNLLGGFAPYLNVTTDKYGNESAWAAAAVGRLRARGFNMVSGWTATVVEQAAGAANMYYSHLLDLGVTWPYAWSRGLDYDVWTSNFTEQVASIAAREVPPRANDSNLTFWQSDNEINWGAVGLACYLRYPAAQPGNGVVLAWLQQRYTTVAALDVAWNISAAGWSDIVNYLDSPSLDKAAFSADDADWQGVVSGQYHKARGLLLCRLRIGASAVASDNAGSRSPAGVCHRHSPIRHQPSVFGRETGRVIAADHCCGCTLCGPVRPAQL